MIKNNAIYIFQRNNCSSSLCTDNKTRVSKLNFSVIKICSMCVYSHNTRTANIGTMSSKINRELAEPVEATQAYLL